MRSAAYAAAALAALAGADASQTRHKHFVCNASKLVVIGGLHHGGTSILQAQLMRRVGEVAPVWHDGMGNRMTSPKEKSVQNPKHYEDACSDEWTIFKMPTNHVQFGSSGVLPFLRLRHKFPEARLVFSTRDLPNQVWSLLKRYGKRGLDDATHFARNEWCQINNYYYAHARPSPLDFTVDLAVFSRLHGSILRAIVPDELLDAPRRRLQAESGPSSPAVVNGRVQAHSQVAHDKLRMEQMALPVYVYNMTRYKDEAPRALADHLERLSCADLADAEGRFRTTRPTRRYERAGSPGGAPPRRPRARAPQHAPALAGAAPPAPGGDGPVPAWYAAAMKQKA